MIVADSSVVSVSRGVSSGKGVGDASGEGPGDTGIFGNTVSGAGGLGGAPHAARTSKNTSTSRLQAGRKVSFGIVALYSTFAASSYLASGCETFYHY
jgi:hypothetical protein